MWTDCDKFQAQSVHMSPLVVHNLDILWTDCDKFQAQYLAQSRVQYICRAAC